MEQTSNTPSTPVAPTKAGKGLSIAGFIIALVALVLWVFVSAAALFQALLGGGTTLAIFWVVVSVIGLLLSVLGFMSAKKGNGKKGLAIAGLIIGIVATGLSVRTVFGVQEAHARMGDAGQEFMNKLEEGMKNATDSMATEMGESMQQMADSLNTK